MLPVLAGVLGSALTNRYAHDPGPKAHDADDSFRARLRQPRVIAFFVADADTPPSVTRSLFEPVVAPVKPVDEIAQDDKQDDDTTEERSA